MASNVCLPPQYSNEVGVVIPLVVQTLAWGFYGCLVILALYLLHGRGLQTISARLTLGVVLVTFVASGGYWTTSFVITMDALKRDWPNQAFTEAEFGGSRDRLLASQDWILLIILACNDSVVVGRACVISSLRAQKWIISVVSLTFAIQVALASTALGISWTTTSIIEYDHHPGHGRNRISMYLLDVAYGMSLSTNIWPTCIIARKMWCHLRDSSAARLPRQRPATMIRNALVLLVKSGLLSSFLLAMYVVFYAIPRTRIYIAAYLGDTMLHILSMWQTALVVLLQLQKKWSDLTPESLPDVYVPPTMQSTPP